MSLFQARSLLSLIVLHVPVPMMDNRHGTVTFMWKEKQRTESHPHEQKMACELIGIIVKSGTRNL